MKKIVTTIIALTAAVSLWAQDISALYNDAAAAFSAKDFATAVTGFEKVISQGESDPTAVLLVKAAKSVLPKSYFLLAGEAFRGAKYADAEKHFLKSAELSVKYGDETQLALTNKWLAELYRIEANTTLANQDFAKSSEILAKGFAADSTNMDIAVKLAVSYGEIALNTGDAAVFSKALDLFVAARTASPDGDIAERAEQGIAYFSEKLADKMQQSGNMEGITALADSMSERNISPAIVEKLRARAAAGEQIKPVE